MTTIEKIRMYEADLEMISGLSRRHSGWFGDELDTIKNRLEIWRDKHKLLAFDAARREGKV